MLKNGLLQISQAAVWLAGLAILFVPLERFFAVHPYKVFRKGVFVDIGYYFIASVVPALMLSLPLAFIAWIVRNIVPDVVLETTGAWPFWGRAFAAMVVGEIGYYWGHRWSHEIPYLWKFHSIHHSAEEVDFLVATRSHPIDFVFSRICEFTPMLFLGLAGPGRGREGVEIPVLVAAFGLIWGFFIHSNLRWRLGPIEWLISTPAFHHWHHTKTGPINHNYSSTLPWLDRIFGTHHLPKEQPDSYGIKSTLPDSLIGQLVYPFEVQSPATHPAPANGSSVQIAATTVESSTATSAQSSELHPA